MLRLVPSRISSPSPSLDRIFGTKMFRHTPKITFNALNMYQHVQHEAPGIRYYRTTTHLRAAKEPGVKECPKDGSGKGFYYTLGSVLIGTGAVIAYAKYDDDFRAWLKENVPGSDEFIKFVMAEETSHVDYIVKRVISFKDAIVNDLSELVGSKVQEDPKKEKKIEGKKEEGEKKKAKYIAPASAFGPNACVDEKEKKFDEKRTSQMVNQTEEITTDPGRGKPKEIKRDGNDPTSLVEIEAMTNKSAAEAIDAYGNAICYFRDHVEEVIKVVEESVDKNDPKVWKSLKQKGKDRENAVKEAEKKAKAAMSNIEYLEKKADDPTLPGGPEVRTKIKKNLERVTAQINKAKDTYEKEKNNATISDTYWKKVYQARSHFADELETLFPNVCITDKSMKLTGGEFDLFILYAYQNILYYQKELSKLDTVSQLKLKTALEKSKIGDPEAIDAAIEVEIEKEKRKICQEYQKRALSLKAECEKDMRNQLRLQNDAASDLLDEALAAKEAEMERKMKREIEDKLADERAKYQSELAAMIGRLKGMDDALRKRACMEKRSKQAQALWTAAESLLAAISPNVVCESKPKKGKKGEESEEEEKPLLKPLANEIKSIRNVTRNEDELVNAVLESIPKVASERGVFNETALRQRFHNVLRVAKKVALLPEGGASLPAMFLAYLASFLIISPSIPCHEILNEPFDSSELNNFEILQRAQYWMDNGDFVQVLKYLNLLQGASKVIAWDFIKELRLYLETKQAGEVLVTYAAAAGLPQ